MPPQHRKASTTHSVFTRPPPSAVTYDLSVPHQATITLPPGSAWTSGPHWHETHTEFLRVVSGAAEIRLCGTLLPAVTAADGTITVPRGVIHEWKRSSSTLQDEPLVVSEWTQPRDGVKEVFFRCVNGLLLESDPGEARKREQRGTSQGCWNDTWQRWMLELELMNVFWRMDNWPLLLPVGWPGIVQWIATKAVLGVALVLGWCLGRKGVYK
ncbi:hypothetical protein JX265_004409 [Neoarthrinium moseri]|uniref:Cupin type-2 domain-containing protein n=1 Tax=Neoarthrinium moseri TaxID=1658444 RepID=A0A9P9WR34_9PEZI|nr:hypothetical protein JX265_004409 [Neoarthrinium moseri]